MTSSRAQHEKLALRSRASIHPAQLGPDRASPFPAVRAERERWFLISRLPFTMRNNTRRLIPDRAQPIEVHLQNERDMSQARIDRQRQHKQAQEQATTDAHPFRPHLQAQYEVELKHNGDVLERMEQWDAQRELRLELARERCEMEELEHVQMTPVLGERTKRLVEQMPERAGIHVAERLYEGAERERAAREAALEQIAREEDTARAPAITRQAAELVRAGDVSERLFEHARQIADKRHYAVELRNKAEQQAMRWSAPQRPHEAKSSVVSAAPPPPPAQHSQTTELASTPTQEQHQDLPGQSPPATLGLSQLSPRGANQSTNISLSQGINQSTSASVAVDADTATVERSHSMAMGNISVCSVAGPHLRSALPIGDDLMRRGRLRQEKHKERADEIRRAEQDAMRPEISTRSIQLANAKASTSRERLLSGTASVPGVNESMSSSRKQQQPPQQQNNRRQQLKVKQQGRSRVRSPVNASKSPASPGELECTFVPEINAISKQLAEAQRRKSRNGGAQHGDYHAWGGQSPAIVARLHEQGALKENRLAQQRALHADRELDGCTFKPQITAVSRQICRGDDNEKSGGNEGHARGPGRSVEKPRRRQSVSERLNAWAAKRDKKISSQQQLRAASETDGCTFQPNIHALYDQGGAMDELEICAKREHELARRSTRVVSRLAAGQGAAVASGPGSSFKAATGNNTALSSVNGAHPGISKHVERLRRGREVTKEKATVRHCNGDAWTGKRTRAIAPNLHTERRAHGAEGRGGAARRRRRGGGSADAQQKSGIPALHRPAMPDHVDGATSDDIPNTGDESVLRTTLGSPRQQLPQQQQYAAAGAWSQTVFSTSHAGQSAGAAPSMLLTRTDLSDIGEDPPPARPSSPGKQTQEQALEQHYLRMERSAKMRADNEAASQSLHPPSLEASVNATHPVDPNSVVIGGNYTGRPTRVQPPHWRGDSQRAPVSVKSLSRPAEYSNRKPLVDVWTGEITTSE